MTTAATVQYSFCATTSYDSLPRPVVLLPTDGPYSDFFWGTFTAMPIGSSGAYFVTGITGNATLALFRRTTNSRWGRTLSACPTATCCTLTTRSPIDTQGISFMATEADPVLHCADRAVSRLSTRPTSLSLRCPQPCCSFYASSAVQGSSFTLVPGAVPMSAANCSLPLTYANLVSPATVAIQPCTAISVREGDQNATDYRQPGRQHQRQHGLHRPVHGRVQHDGAAARLQLAPTTITTPTRSSSRSACTRPAARCWLRRRRST